jgi:hypothetical protein
MTGRTAWVPVLRLSCATCSAPFWWPAARCGRRPQYCLEHRPAYDVHPTRPTSAGYLEVIGLALRALRGGRPSEAQRALERAADTIRHADTDAQTGEHP